MNPEVAIKWAISFLPGFVALFVFGQIVDSSNIKEFEFIFYLVLLTIITSSVSWPFISLINRFFGAGITFSQLHIVGTPLLVVFGFLVGGVMGYLSEKNSFYHLIKKIPITSDINVVSRKPVSIYILDQNSEKALNLGVDAREVSAQDDHAWVKVLVEGGKEYHGWPGLFSKGKKFDELFLTPACHLKSGKLIQHDGAGILLFSRYIQGIEFMDRDQSECSCLWFKGEWDGKKCS